MAKYIGLKPRHIQHAIDAVLIVNDSCRDELKLNLSRVLKEKLAIELDSDADCHVVGKSDLNSVVIKVPSKEQLDIPNVDDDLSFEKIFMAVEKSANMHEKEIIIGKIVDHDDAVQNNESIPHCSETWNVFKKRIQ